MTVWGISWSRRRGSNPHGTKYHWILSPARLPVPPLRACYYQHSMRVETAQPGLFCVLWHSLLTALGSPLIRMVPIQYCYLTSYLPCATIPRAFVIASPLCFPLARSFAKLCKSCLSCFQRLAHSSFTF